MWHLKASSQVIRVATTRRPAKVRKTIWATSSTKRSIPQTLTPSSSLVLAPPLIHRSRTPNWNSAASLRSTQISSSTAQTWIVAWLAVGSYFFLTARLLWILSWSKTVAHLPYRKTSLTKSRWTPVVDFTIQNEWQTCNWNPKKPQLYLNSTQTQAV